MNETNNFEVLTSSCLWVATPWYYSSSRWLRFHNDGNAEFCYGFGQTIYAVIKCQFELVAEDLLRITYLESPAVQFFKGFRPKQDNELKDIRYILKQEIVEGRQDILGREYKYHWTLTISGSPYPDEITFPYEMPLIYHGHREVLQSEKQ